MADYEVAVLTEDGQPLVGVEVEAVSTSSYPSVSARAKTDRSGKATFSGLSGSHLFRVRTRRAASGLGNRFFSGDIEIQIIKADFGTGGGGLTPHDHTAADGSGVLTGDEHDSYSQWTETTTPANPAQNSIRIFARDAGNGFIEFVARSSTGEEAVLAKLYDFQHVNTLTLNLIE